MSVSQQTTILKLCKVWGKVQTQCLRPSSAQQAQKWWLSAFIQIKPGISDHVYYRWPRSTYRPTMDRYIGRLSVDYRSTIGRQSADYRSTVDRQSTDSRPIVDLYMYTFIGRVSADISVDYRSTIDRLSVDSRPIVDRQSTDISADVSADMSTEATYSTHDPVFQRVDSLYPMV